MTPENAKSWTIWVSYARDTALRKTLSWLLTGRRPLWAAVIVVLVILLIILLVTDHPIASFNLIASYATAQPENATWVASLVAAAIALLGILATQIVNTVLARSGRRSQQDLEDRRAQHDALQKYFEQMGQLLTKEKLRCSQIDDDVRVLARSQTLMMLQGLGPDRKRILLGFLYESHLITGDDSIVSLAGADLKEAVLDGAHLDGTHLNRVLLNGAHLNEADLKGAQLSGDRVTQEQLAVCKSLKGETMPDGSKHH